MKVCFWGDIAGALTGNTSGGSELQVALLARGLVKAGHEVVCIDVEITEDFITSEGIKVFRIKGWNSGIRVIRLFTHRLPQLYLLLKKQKADIYYCRMRDFRNILAFWAARKTKSKFILAMASDLDALGFRMSLKYSYLPYIGNIGGLWWIFNGLLNEIVHPWLLRKADLVLTQHEGQKNILQEKNIKSMVFLNIFDMTGLPVVSDPSHKDFIYVGELNKIKGFSDFFEIVKKAPFHSFKVVGQPQDRTGHLYYEKLKSYKNVYLLGRLSHSDTLWQIANSKALISTSPMEGFPNIFIEAWACGIPVFSLYVDPGSVIENEELGVVGHGNIDRLLSEMDNYRNTDEFTERAKTYVEHNHVLNTNRIKEINCLLS